MHACTYTNTNRSYNREGRRGNLKRPPACISPSQVKPIRDQTRLRFKHRHCMKNQNTTSPAFSVLFLVFQLMLQKQRVPQPVGVLKVQQRSSMKGIRALTCKPGSFALCAIWTTKTSSKCGETSSKLFLKGRIPSSPLVLDDTLLQASNCSSTAGESVFNGCLAPPWTVPFSNRRGVTGRSPIDGLFFALNVITEGFFSWR